MQSQKMKTSRFSQYAAEASNRMFLGRLIKFRKGDFEEGSDQAPISPSERFVAVMDTVTVGHIKWVGGKPVDSQMGLVADGFRAPHRNELGDLDSETWAIGENGDRIDPWQRTTVLVLASEAAPHDLFTFSTSTAGGQSAIGDLCEAHARATGPLEQYPVVTLGVDSYQHKIKSLGRIKVPVFKIVDCVDAGPFNAVVAGARGGAGFIPAGEPPPLLATPRMGPMGPMGQIAIGSGRDARGGWNGNDNGESPPLEHDGRFDLDDDGRFGLEHDGRFGLDDDVPF